MEVYGMDGGSMEGYIITIVGRENGEDGAV